MATRPQKHGAIIRIATILFFLLAVSCSDSGVADPVDTNAPDMTIDVAPDVPEPDLGPQFVQQYCNGSGDYNTAPYVDSVMSQQCVGNFYRSIIRLFECKGCSSPTICAECERPPSHYYLINLENYDDDQTGAVLSEENGFVFRCQIEGQCTEVVDFDITIETHQPGTCASGQYRFANGATDITGTFDAATIEPVDLEEAQACRER